MKRTVPALDLARNPLLAVLAQVRITPVLSMATFIPSIQEQLRKDYPRFFELRQEELVLGPQPTTRSSLRWNFIDKDGFQGITVAPNVVLFQVTRYTSFENFTANLRSILKIVGAEARLSLSDRIGLRYVNRIAPEDGESLEDYLQPGVLGVSRDKLGTSDIQLRFEQRGKTPAPGKLVIRVIQQDGAPDSLPPGLDLNGMTLPQFNGDGSKTILDVDHFSESQRDYDPDSLVADMWKLHEFTDRAFRAAVTDSALAKWRKK